MTGSTVSLVEAGQAARAEAQAQVPTEKQGSTALLVCRVGGTWLALEAEYVQTIMDVSPAVPVPHTPRHILGVISHGDGALAVVDLAVWLHLDGGAASSDLSTHGRIVVVRVGDLQAGLSCEKVAGVREVVGAWPQPKGVLQGERLNEFLVAELHEPEGTIGVLEMGRLLEALRVKA